MMEAVASRGRIRYVGEVVPLSEEVAQASVILVAPDAQGDPVPIGTGFFVGMPGPVAAIGVSYVVTAAHVVRFAPKTYIRVSRNDGAPEDLPVPQWEFHDDGESDVAVAPVNLNVAFYRYRMLPLVMFMDESAPELKLGDDVYFIGLLAPVKSMHRQNVPMVRSGTVGRLYQDGVLVKWPDGTEHSMTAHLVDCRSHSGFSGSPCYVQFPLRGRLNQRVPGIDTFLLGLITGHLDDLGADLSIKNTGVVLVTPVEAIRHVLMQEPFASIRAAAEKLYRHDHPPVQEVAVMDSSSKPPEFERFEDLTRKLVNTPKPPKESEPN